jgi:hypothetical protein
LPKNGRHAGGPIPQRQNMMAVEDHLTRGVAGRRTSTSWAT